MYFIFFPSDQDSVNDAVRGPVKPGSHGRRMGGRDVKVNPRGGPNKIRDLLRYVPKSKG